LRQEQGRDAIYIRGGNGQLNKEREPGKEGYFLNTAKNEKRIVTTRSIHSVELRK